jgi:glutathione S-transferase
MKLYHAPLSSSSRRVTITAHHLGIRFDEQLIDLGRTLPGWKATEPAR